MDGAVTGAASVRLHSFGLQGRTRRYSKQRESAQFKDSKGPAHAG